jgi:hypothetical protein
LQKCGRLPPLFQEGKLEEMFLLTETTGENWDEACHINEFLNHFHDPEWKSYILEHVHDILHDICDKKKMTSAVRAVNGSTIYQSTGYVIYCCQLHLFF